jgi:competence protein ComFC
MLEAILDCVAQGIKSLTHLLYPPLCLHCNESLGEKTPLLCPSCLTQLELIDPRERCPYCVSADYTRGQPCCDVCLRKKPVLHGVASAFDYIGPAATIIKQMKYYDQPYLAKGAGAYLAVQLLRLKWPLPDYLIPVPMQFTRWIDRGYNQSHLLAEELSRILNRPLSDVLKRKSGDFSQAALSYQQRIVLEGESFEVKKRGTFRDKSLLLIDDVMTTGSTLRRCAEALLGECPRRIYGLTVCRAMK